MVSSGSPGSGEASTSWDMAAHQDSFSYSGTDCSRSLLGRDHSWRIRPATLAMAIMEAKASDHERGQFERVRTLTSIRWCRFSLMPRVAATNTT